MWKALTVFFLCVPVAAQAFSQCTVTAIGGPGAEMAEEGSNPVAAGAWAYAGYTQGNKAVVVAASANGNVLGAPVTVSVGSGAARDIRLAAFANRVYAAWQQHTTTGYHLMVAASHGYGAPGSWNAPVDLGQVLSDIAQISADGTDVHVVYLTTDGTATVSSSTNSGRSFGAPVGLGASSGEVVIENDGRHVYAAFETGKLYVHRYVMLGVSPDRGATFTVTNVSDNGVRDAREPILTVNRTNGRLSLVWRESRPVNAVYLQSLDHGQSWSTPLVVDVPARQVMVQDDGDLVYVSYLKKFQISGVYDWQVYLALSRDGGLSFPSRRNLTGPTGISRLHGDDDRPIPWALSGKFRLTGIEADGVHIWGGQSGHLRGSAFLGAGTLASPQGHVAAWQAPDGVVDYAFCN